MKMKNLFLEMSIALALAITGASTAQAEADFSGTWIVAGGGGGGSDAFDKNPESEWSLEKLPFTAEGRQIFLANHPGKGPRLYKKPPERNDPLVKGNPPGLYRTLVYSRPMQFVKVPGQMLQLFSWSRAWRPIYMDRPVPREIVAGPYWYGYSVGKWEGDTLVVNTIAVDSRGWFDEWGTPISDDARIEERWQRISADTLQLKVTVTDPAIYTKPWTSMPILMKLQKKGVEFEEVIHAPMDEELFDQLITTPAGG